MSGVFFSEISVPTTSIACLSLTAVVAAYHDWRSWRVPNTLVAGSMAAALMLAIFSPSGMGIAECLLGGLAGIAIFMPLYLTGGMGAGDVKLMGSLGMHAGWLLTIEIALVSALVGGAFAVVNIAKRSETFIWLTLKSRAMFGLSLSAGQGPGDLKEKPPIMKAGSAGTLPYAVVIAIGTGLVIASRWIA